jgi:hypothetical protein
MPIQNPDLADTSEKVADFWSLRTRTRSGSGPIGTPPGSWEGTRAACLTCSASTNCPSQ